jgi:hypothetical protein
MKGNNILKVNSSTVVEAMQEYLYRRSSTNHPADKVVSVCAGDGWFSFVVAERLSDKVKK